MSKRRKTSETEMGATLREWAAGYAASAIPPDGVTEEAWAYEKRGRAQGLLQAADYVDAELARPLGGSTFDPPSPGELGDHERRIALLEQAVFDVKPSKVLPSILGAPRPRPAQNGAPVKEKKHPTSAPASFVQSTLSPCARAILAVVCERGTRARVGLDPSRPYSSTDRTQAILMAGYSVRSGGVGPSIADLKDQGLIEVRAGGKLAPTDQGVIEAPREPRRVGPDLLAFWGRKLSPCARAMLSEFVKSYPQSITNGDLCVRIGYRPTSGGISTSLRELRDYGLIDGSRAAEAFMNGIKDTKE